MTRQVEEPVAAVADAVSLRDVRIAYPAERRGQVLAVDGVSFGVRPGEKLVLLGPSGCGKSTLLKAVGGFLPVTGGEILVGGRPVRRPSPERALVFQEFDQLFPWQTALANITLALRLTGRCRDERPEGRARRFLAMMGIEDAADRFPHALSGGMKQRVAIARALALEPEVLLMDEPFGALDAITRSRLQGELNETWRKTGVTLMFVTHSIQEAVLIGHRIVVLSPGPGRIREIVDASGVERPEDGAAAPLRQHLRELLETPGSPRTATHTDTYE